MGTDILFREMGYACVLQALTKHIALDREPVTGVSSPIEFNSPEFFQIVKIVVDHVCRHIGIPFF
jgi:hypothetical protein